MKKIYVISFEDASGETVAECIKCNIEGLLSYLEILKNTGANNIQAIIIDRKEK